MTRTAPTPPTFALARSDARQWSLLRRVLALRFFCLLGITCLVVSQAGCGLSFRNVDPAPVAPQPDTAAVIAHRLPLRASDVVLLVDQSGSMSGGPGYAATDPEALRIEAGHYLIGNLGSKAASGQVPRMGVVSFGTEAPLQHVMPLTPLRSDVEIRAVSAGLRPVDLGWTNFLAAFRQAASLFETAGTFEQDRAAVIVVITDGEPMDARRLVADAYFRELETFFGTELPHGAVDLFVVGIDAADKSWSKHRNRWEAMLPTESSAVFDLASFGDLHQVYNDVIRILYELPDVEPQIVSGDRDLVFELPAYLEWVEFHVFPDTAELQLSITRPDGTTVLESDDDVYIDTYGLALIVVVTAPEPGVWKYSIGRGEGHVEVFRNMVPVQLHLLSPRPREVFGTEQEIAVRFSRHEGTPLTPHPDYPLQVEVTLVNPAGQEERLLLVSDAPGMYVSDRTFRANAVGTHSVTVAVHAAGAFSHSNTYRVDVLELPYLAAVYPQADQNISVADGLAVEVVMMLGDRVTDPVGPFATPPTALVIAWLQTEGQARSPAHYVLPLGGGRFGALLPYKVTRGPNTIRYRIVGILADGAPYPGDELVVVFRGTVPFWRLALPWIVAGLVGFFGTVSYSWVRRPVWRGILAIEHRTDPGQAKSIHLSRFGRKSRLRIGPAGHIPLDDPDNPRFGAELTLVTRQTDYGSAAVPRMRFWLSEGQPADVQEFVHGDETVEIGSWIVRYWKF